MATSLSTLRSSNVWGMNASFLSTLLHIGHGAGPRVNRRSMQDSHLAGLMRRGRVRPKGDRHFVVAGTDEKAKSWVQISVALADGTLVVHGLTGEVGETGRKWRRGGLTKYSVVLPEGSLTPPLKMAVEEEAGLLRRGVDERVVALVTAPPLRTVLPCSQPREAMDDVMDWTSVWSAWFTLEPCAGVIRLRSRLYQMDNLPSTPDDIPAFYFAHGSPSLEYPSVAALPDGLAAFLRNFGPALLKKYKPKGIVVFSAHWETSGSRLGTLISTSPTNFLHLSIVTDYGDENPLLMDYYGFPLEMYQLTFKSRGDSRLSDRIVQLYKEVSSTSHHPISALTLPITRRVMLHEKPLSRSLEAWTGVASTVQVWTMGSSFPSD